MTARVERGGPRREEETRVRPSLGAQAVHWCFLQGPQPENV